MRNRQIPAFTLMEMTMAMLIAAIVIGITYSVYALTLKQFNMQQKKSGRTASLLRLDELLKKDFDRADHIFWTDSGVICKKGNSTSYYTFRPDAVIRTSGIVDTFKFGSVAQAFMYENNQLESGGMENNDSLIDECKLVMKLGKDTITLHYQKTYSSTDLINKKN